MIRRNCSRAFSLRLKYFPKAKSRLAIPGPSRILRAELPNRPTLVRTLSGQIGLVSGHPGILKAEASNQRSMARAPPGRLPAPIRSGLPPIGLVYEGSRPVKVGLKYCPDCKLTFQLVCQPPNNPSTQPPAPLRNR